MSWNLCRDSRRCPHHSDSGEALNPNQHLHGLLADGLFMPDGSFQYFTEIDQARLTRSFAEYVLAALQVRELISDDVVAQILSQQHSGFGVWLGDPFHDADSKRFVSRYIERGPISLEKLSIEDDIVTYITADGTAHEFDPLEFLALISCHVPKRYESLTRYYGWYSSRARGERAKQSVAAVTEAASETEDSSKPSSSWCVCIQRIYEIDPLECPRCKAKMRIVAFVQDPAEIAKIMKAQGLPHFRAPPPLPKPHFSDEHLFHDDMPNYL